MIETILIFCILSVIGFGVAGMAAGIFFFGAVTILAAWTLVIIGKLFGAVWRHVR